MQNAPFADHKARNDPSFEVAHFSHVTGHTCYTALLHKCHRSATSTGIHILFCSQIVTCYPLFQQHFSAGVNLAPVPSTNPAPQAANGNMSVDAYRKKHEITIIVCVQLLLSPQSLLVVMRDVT